MPTEPNASDAPRSRLTLRVRFGETDLMGIVHHRHYLSYFEAGRVDYFHKRGMSYEEWNRRGIHLPVVEASVRYKKPARFDDVLTVETRCAEITKVTVRFSYRVSRGDDVLTTGETLLACVGPSMRPTRIPPDLRTLLEQPGDATEATEG